MSTTTTEEIKNRLDIVDFISGYLRVQKAGRNFRALCPFHNEKTPSFMISQERQIWHCFGCNESGDIFTFLMKIEGVEFKDALLQLAQRAGVRLEKYKSDSAGKRQKILKTLEAAAKFFENNLQTNVGSGAYKYLIERGLTKNSIKDFQIGYSLDSWDGLLKFLGNKSFKDTDLFDAGLIVKRENDNANSLQNKNYYDRFRNRIMFPINDISGKVIGFSARVMPDADDKMGKYINTPETLVYNKSKVIYGLDKAKLAIRKSNFCILVEGQLDVIMSHQAGVKNTVAASGTALTVEHLAIIKRYTKNLALCFDSDEAGNNATKRAIDLAIAAGFVTKVIMLESGKDAADIVKDEPKLWVKAIGQKKLVISFYFDSIFKRHNPDDIEHKKMIADELLPIIQLIPNHIERAHYLQELARKIKVEERILETMLKELKDKSQGYPLPRIEKNLNQSNVNKKVSRAQELGEFILAVTLLYPEYRSGIMNKMQDTWFDSLDQRLIFKNLKQESDDFELKKFINQLNESLRKEVNLIIFKTEQEIEQRSLEPAKIIDEYVSELKKLRKKNQLNELVLEIKQAEAGGNTELVKKLSSEFKRISSES